MITLAHNFGGRPEAHGLVAHLAGAAGLTVGLDLPVRSSAGVGVLSISAGGRRGTAAGIAEEASR